MRYKKDRMKIDKEALTCKVMPSNFEIYQVGLENDYIKW